MHATHLAISFLWSYPQWALNLMQGESVKWLIDHVIEMFQFNMPIL